MTGWEAWQRARRGQVEPVYLIAGPWTFWVREWWRTLREDGRWPVTELEGRVGWAKVAEALARAEWFARKRVVLVREAGFSGKEAGLRAYLTHPAEGAVLVLSESKPAPRLMELLGTERVIEPKPPTAAEMRAFVAEEAQARRVSLTRGAVEWMSEVLFDQGDQVRSELEKMALWGSVHRRGIWDRDQVAEFVTAPEGGPLWRLVDAFVERDVQRALGEAEAALERGELPVVLVVMLARQLEALLLAVAVREGGGDVAAFQHQARLNPAAARRLWARSARWSRGELTWALQWAKRVDQAVKGGAGDPGVWLTAWIATVTPRRRGQNEPPPDRLGAGATELAGRARALEF
ncbi:MAG: hypothetical protein K6U14_04890 [Firmicutes bacterium]|nr:hypothetical protein [Alicyclobacillaceae bacterium]MCL6496957.1 hypothetical protein [Bacillota bacterium]